MTSRKRSIALAIFFAVFALTAALSGWFLSAPSTRPEQSAESFSFSSKAPPNSALNLIEDLQQNRVRLNSVEDFIQLLPDSLRSSYVFIYASHSLQSASPQFPRAFAF